MYRDYRGWPQLFPATIAGVRPVSAESDAVLLEVAHKREGPVVNRLRVLSSKGIELCEWKQRYDARFVNYFEPDELGTRYTLSAEITVKGAWRMLEPFMRPYVTRQMVRFVVEPLRRHAEALSTH